MAKRYRQMYARKQLQETEYTSLDYKALMVLTLLRLLTQSKHFQLQWNNFVSFTTRAADLHD